MATVAITGITGLAGGRVGHGLRDAGHGIVGISRRAETGWAGQQLRVVSDLSDADAMTAALAGCDVVFHFADRADRRSYRDTDVGSAAAVLTAIRVAAARNGIDRIVVASSVHADRPDRTDDLYGRSKRAMEEAGMTPTPGTRAAILRLPPLHGAGARGAVRHIARAVEKGWPLPFALAQAPRRFLSLDALTDLCVHLTAADDPAFARMRGNILVPVNVRQGSLAALSRSLGSKRVRLLPVPGIDRLLGGRVTAGQLQRDRDTLVEAVGWEARD